MSSRHSRHHRSRSRSRSRSESRSRSRSPDEKQRHHRKEKDKHKHKHKHHHKKEKKHHKDSKKHRHREANHHQAEISKDNYYDKNTEFRSWLKSQKKLYFDELDTEKSHALFGEFVKAWNSGELEAKYYAGEIEEDSSERTRYKWNFVNKIDHVFVGNIKDQIAQDNRRITVHSGLASSTAGPTAPASYLKSKLDAASEECSEDEEEEKKRLKAREKAEKKRYRKYKEVVEEELVPKETGKFAIMEKKKEKARQAAKSTREDSPEMDDRSLMGGGADFKAMLQKQKNREAAKQAERQRQLGEKMAAYRQKEEDTMKEFRALISTGNIPLLANQARPQVPPRPTEKKS